MDFLKSEVEGDERIALARAGFGVPARFTRPLEKSRIRRDEDQDELPIAAGLINSDVGSCLL